MIISETVNNYIRNQLKSINPNLDVITDEIDATKGHSLFIDTSSIAITSTDQAYVRRFIGECKKFNHYKCKIILVPLKDWCAENPNPTKSGKLAALLRYMKSSPEKFKHDLAGFTFIFIDSNNEGIALEVDKFNPSQLTTLTNGIEILIKQHRSYNAVGNNSSNSQIEKANNAPKNPVKAVNTSKEETEAKEKKKQELVKSIAAAAETSETEEELLDKIDSDVKIAEILSDLDDGRTESKLTRARMERMGKLNKEFEESDFNGRSVRSMIETHEKEIPSSSIKVHSINEEWNNVKFINFEKSYDLDADIMKVLTFFADKIYPVSIIDVKVEDTSTSMDYLYTYTVHMEDSFGKRFTLVFDIPKLRNNKFFKLRGNDKVLNGQLVLLPCTKSDNDTVQLVSNYNKIFIRRQGVIGRSSPVSDRLVKALHKLQDNKSDKHIKIYFGDNSKVCDKYSYLPIDYIDAASAINRIETLNSVYYFNQDIYRQNFKYEAGRGIPYAINKNDNSIRYWTPESVDSELSKEEVYNSPVDTMCSTIVREIRNISQEFDKIYKSTKSANRLAYSRASIMSNKIPMAVVVGYYIGISELRKKMGGDSRSRLDDKKVNYNPDVHSRLRLKDSYITYRNDDDLAMLFNGLKECDLEDYTYDELCKKSAWLDILDNFGGRLLADGLDNFRELFIDPITEEVIQHQKLKVNDYIDLLLCGSSMLTDNTYIKHTDISGNRYRSNELIASYLYKCLAKSYADYYINIKRGRKQGMSIKRSAVIDAIMSDPTSSDLSILNPLLELEASNAVSFKGLSGMNSDRSYSLDKRTYDKSMQGKLALSTGFAANVGINRQTTIDMGISGDRGYINPTREEDDLTVTSNFSITEAVTPFGSTSDDPFRTAMTFIQTSKHSMRTDKSCPMLISNGADEAMPYMSSNTFVVKALGNGKVKELNPEYMVLEYDKAVNIDGEIHTTQYVNLKEEVKKNSDGGFYVTVKLDTDLGEGKRFKEGDIVAYDRSSYSNKVGEADFLAYNVGTLAKVAIICTDEGYEDSTSVSEWVSEAMASDVVTCEPYTLDRLTNIYEVKKVGDYVQEGDPLMIMQNAFEEEDANVLLKYITGDSEVVSDLGRIRIKSKYTGYIQDIKIYRTCEIEEMSDSLAKLVKEYEKGIKAKKAIYKNNGIPGENILDPDYKMKSEGKLKNVINGVMIEFYIKYHDKLSVGDKIVAQSASKGVVRSIFPKDNEPYSEFRPDEKIHAMFAADSFNRRMVSSPIKSGLINKILIELDRQIKDIMGLEAKSIEDIQ